MARGRKLWLAAQWIFAALVIWYAARALSGQWSEVGERLRATRLAWSDVALASVLMLLSYAILIEAWRRLLAEWSVSLQRLDAARIWLASNLGKYVPGKIWSILAMGALARARGASALAAGGSSVVMQVMSVVTGVAVAAAFGATSRGLAWLAILSAGALIGAIIAAPAVLPRAFGLLGSLTGRPVASPVVPRRAVWIAALTTIIAWLLAGLAFRAFCAAIGVGSGPTSSYISVYAASYVAGFVALFAPGGIGVREGALVATMERAGLASAAEAAVIAVASRIWLTLLELLPGLIALALAPRADGESARSTRGN